MFDYMNQNRAHFWSRRAADQRALVFVGDSLTGGWSTLAKDFPQVKTANRGIGGDVTRGMLFRFGEDVLDLNPIAVVMLAGSADLSALQAPSVALRNISAMAGMLKKRLPTTPLVLCTVPPRLNAAAPVNPARIAELNEGIKQFASSRDGVVVVDLHTALSDSEGNPVPAYFAPDLLHLSPAGYRVWKAELEPSLRRIGILT
ncbi:GDSL-type esterase/lipase family protein [uncultured Aquabacterium sp.]|uniref:GDSL-type esterase/lipase family protein n=1 Tax=uncultured Aquabacterium sp. TaxID=158753 RepID=UPI0025E61B05|nr:GDSL-type esterase/lipase family protein [uncultured Aquabacterium sp.]